ncbi:MAG TPA: flagellar biosynthetic protein FliO [Terriglobia bacterium]|nr:flagellar biosynthetic protein FliO [Terriglobia bacterium]
MKYSIRSVNPPVRFMAGLVLTLALAGSLSRAQAQQQQPPPVRQPEALGPSAELARQFAGSSAAGSLALPDDDTMNEAEAGGMGLGARATGALIVVLALIWISVVLLKKYMPHRFGAIGQKRRIQVLETVPVGEKRALTLIRIDDEELLLASTPGSFSLLKEIRPDPNRGKTVSAVDGPAPADAAGFSVTKRFEHAMAEAIGVRGPGPDAGPLTQLALLRKKLEAR